MRKLFVLFLTQTVLCSPFLVAQSYRFRTVFTGIQPSIQYTLKFHSNSELNLSQGARINNFEQNTIIDSEIDFKLAQNEHELKFIRTDWTALYSRKVNFNWKLGLGYMYRISPNYNYLHRFIQQAVYTRKLKTISFSTRLRAE